MFKLMRVGVATLLGVLLALTLFVSGAFAQHVDARHGNLPSTHQVVTQPLSHTFTHCGGCWGGGWGGGWGGDWGWDGDWGW